MRRRLKQEADQPGQFDCDTLELEETVYEHGDNGRIRDQRPRATPDSPSGEALVGFVRSIPANRRIFQRESAPNRHQGRARLQSQTPAPAC